MKMKEAKSVKRGKRIKRDSRKQERKEGEDERRAKYQGACQCGGANGGGTKVASNFSLLSSEMTLQI